MRRIRPLFPAYLCRPPRSLFGRIHEPNGAGDNAHHDRTQKREKKYRFRLTKRVADLIIGSGSYRIACQYGNAVMSPLVFPILFPDT